MIRVLHGSGCNKLLGFAFLRGMRSAECFVVIGVADGLYKVLCFTGEPSTGTCFLDVYEWNGRNLDFLSGFAMAAR